MFEFFGSQSFDQIIALSILAVACLLFIQDRWRYDVVALMVLATLVLAGTLPYQTALSNFGHPAIIIVASMFVMGQALVQSGIIDTIVGRLTFLHTRPILALGLLVIFVVLLSAFINNVGALVMVLPIAIHLAKKSHTPISIFLLPLAFASHLGGYLTLIGTPRNILISDFREQVTGTPFQMFDFLSVGAYIAVLGALFLILISWRMIPIRKNKDDHPVGARIFVTEVIIPEHSKILSITIPKLQKSLKNTITVCNIIRDTMCLPLTDSYLPLPGDQLQVKGDLESLTQFVNKYSLELNGIRSIEWHVSSDDDHATVEAIVTPYSRVIGKKWNDVQLKNRFGSNFIGIARKNLNLTSGLADIPFQPGDIILLQGRTDSIKHTLASMNCMMLAETGIAFGRTRTILGTLFIIITAIILASLNVFPVAIIFLIAAIALVAFDLISIKQAYESIEVPVLMLLAGMIALGSSIQLSGADDTLALALSSLINIVGPISILFILLIVTMLLADFMNTTASAVVMAPVAIQIALLSGSSIDPFLMIVAIGASASFLTPVGHESNALVMRRGGYKFTDYFKIGLPLEIIQVIVTVPLVLHFWPL